MASIVPGGPRGLVRHRDTIVMVACGGLLLLSGCDSFFGVHGRVVDCASTMPLQGVSIDVHVDRGYQDRMEMLTHEATTDANGRYTFEINDPSESWATLTFLRQGYTSFVTEQLRGHKVDDPPVDLCLEQEGVP